MWRWEEHILPVLDNARYARIKPAVAVDWDVCPRSGESRSLTVGDIAYHKYGMEIAVEKIEERRERLFESALEAEEGTEEHLESVQTELEKLRALGLEL